MLAKIKGRRRRGPQRMRWLDGTTDSTDIESEQAPGIGDGQGSLACCSPRGLKESDTTERVNDDNRQPPWFPFPSPTPACEGPGKQYE